MSESTRSCNEPLLRGIRAAWIQRPSNESALQSSATTATKPRLLLLWTSQERGGGRSTDIQSPISKGLTSKMPAHKKSPVKDWAERGERDSNPRVLDLQSSALATWPPPHPDHAGQTAQRLWPVPAARIIGEVSADDPLR